MKARKVKLGNEKKGMKVILDEPMEKENSYVRDERST